MSEAQVLVRTPETSIYIQIKLAAPSGLCFSKDSLLTWDWRESMSPYLCYFERDYVSMHNIFFPYMIKICQLGTKGNQYFLVLI